MLAGVVVSFELLRRLSKRDAAIIPIYFGGLGGAFLGAKFVYLAAEGWMHWHDADRWWQFAAGKSIVGALLGGYAGVEIVKARLGYRRITGDWFAVMVPIPIILGRVGCTFQGCCPGRACEPAWYTMADAAGIARWPTAPVELVFNALMLGIVLVLRHRQTLVGQHFHVYLMAYGLFRFAHEFVRDTPKLAGSISGYQIAALGVALLGGIQFARRRRQPARSAWRLVGKLPTETG